MRSNAKSPAYSRVHDSATENLITAAQALLEVDRKSGDGVAISIADRRRTHAQVEQAIAALRAPTSPASALCMTRADGRRLAAEMLRMLERCEEREANAFSFDGYEDAPDGSRLVYRTSPQSALLAGYLTQLEGNPAALDGFLSVVDDALMQAHALDLIVSADEYRRPPRELASDAEVIA